MASDEIAAELLIRAHALARLLAVSILADDPTYSNLAPVPPTIKARFAADLEGALALRPDLVILASFNKPETLARFKDAKVSTHILGNFTTLADIEANITTIGALLHTDKEASTLVQELKQGLAALTPAKSGQPRLQVLDFHPGGSVSGSGTLFEALVHAAGGENLAAKKGWSGWPALNAEILAGLAPDAIVAAGEEKDRAMIRAQLLNAPGWKSMRTVTTARLILIPERELSATSHHILKAAVKLNNELVGAAR